MSARVLDFEGLGKGVEMASKGREMKACDGTSAL
jgi:hypothetical protein